MVADTTKAILANAYLPLFARIAKAVLLNLYSLLFVGMPIAISEEKVALGLLKGIIIVVSINIPLVLVLFVTMTFIILEEYINSLLVAVE